MKVFQILHSICHWDATSQYPTLDCTKGLFAPDIVFVEAPDYVFEGWGFDSDMMGNERFIKPIPPEGWIYDDSTGTFFPANYTPPPTAEDRIAELEKDIKLKEAQISALSEQNDFQEELIVELANVVYA